jgi:hypothetical protein
MSTLRSTSRIVTVILGLAVMPKQTILPPALRPAFAACAGTSPPALSTMASRYGRSAHFSASSLRIVSGHLASLYTAPPTAPSSTARATLASLPPVTKTRAPAATASCRASSATPPPMPVMSSVWPRAS